MTKKADSKVQSNQDPEQRARDTESLQIEGGQIADAAPDASGIRVFKGIPYAAPPVGELRWKAPQPVQPWNGIRGIAEWGPR